MLDVYTRQPRAAATPQAYRLTEYAAAFDNQPVPFFSLQESLRQRIPQYSLDVAWSHGIHLVGYDLERQQLRAGKPALLTLYWQIQTDLAARYIPVATILNNDAILGEVAKPLCQRPATAAWSPDYINTTAFTIQPYTPLSPGAYRVQVSLQQVETGETLRQVDETNSRIITSFLVNDTGVTP
jgi:hypothetical protein